MADIIKKARVFATSAHKGQIRKYSGEPYINHPINVALKVLETILDEEVITAAVLHDVIEDTPITYQDILKNFGKHIADLVNEVSDISKSSDGNRKVRKEIDKSHLANASPDGKSIKLADLIDNSSSILINDPSFAKVYMEEKKSLLEVLKEGHPILYNEAKLILQEYERRK